MRRFFITLLAVSLIVAVGVALNGIRARSRVVASSTVSGSLRQADLEQQVDAIQKELQLLKASRSPTQPVTLLPSVAGLKESVAPALEESDAKAESQRAKTWDLLDRKITQEKKDPAWSDKTEGSMREALSIPAALPGTALVSVSCASTLCRVSLEHANDGAQKALASAVSQLSPFRGAVYYKYHTDTEKLATTLYVVREGHESELQTEGML